MNFKNYPRRNSSYLRGCIWGNVLTNEQAVNICKFVLIKILNSLKKSILTYIRKFIQINNYNVEENLVKKAWLIAS
jgi:hypothetical protein